VIPRPATGREDGFSLVELTITMMLLGVVLAIVMAGLSTFTRTANSAERRMQNLEQARTMMAVVTRDLRTATPISASDGSRQAAFVTVTSTSVEFYGNLRFQAPASSTTTSTTPTLATPVRVRLALETDPLRSDRSQLTETVSTITGTVTSRKRVLGTSLLNSTATGSELFCYEDATAATTTTASATAWCPGTTPAVDAIASVKVRLLVQTTTGDTSASLTSSVWLPNIALDKVTL
jgi:prepilin-type N-terminal cleavage/methylation domain-containing protein